MNLKIKKLWLKDLRSGEILQATNGLGSPFFSNPAWRNDDYPLQPQLPRRCCLGVLCDIAVREGVIPPPILKHPGYLLYANCQIFLPKPVVVWAGLASNDPKIEQQRSASTLSEMNDKGCTFREIADVIEKAAVIPDS